MTLSWLDTWRCTGNDSSLCHGESLRIQISRDLRPNINSQQNEVYCITWPYRSSLRLITSSRLIWSDNTTRSSWNKASGWWEENVFWSKLRYMRMPPDSRLQMNINGRRGQRRERGGNTHWLYLENMYYWTLFLSDSYNLKRIETGRKARCFYLEETVNKCNERRRMKFALTLWLCHLW